MAIDMHAHWVPRRLVETATAGGDWFGWRLIYDRSGQECITIGDRVARLKISHGSLTDP